MGNALHTKGNTPGVGVTDTGEARLDDAGLLAVGSGGLVSARTGVMAGPGSASLVSGTSSTAPMRYSVAAHHWVTNRGVVSDGVYRGAAEAVKLVDTTAAPGSGSRIDIVYVKQNDAGSTISPDATSAPVYGCAQGTSTTGTPTAPSIPTGAEELARVTVTSAATRTDGAGVTITQTARQTVARGGILPVRSKAERDAVGGYSGAPVWRQDTKVLEILASTGALAAVLGPMKLTRTAGTDSGARTNATVGMHPAVTINRPFGEGVPFLLVVYAASFVVVGASSVAWLSATGDPTANPAGRIGVTGSAQGFNVLDSGATDSLAFQPQLKADGTVTPFADPNAAYSLALAFPKAL